jgi:hypothetical protein
MGLDGLFRWLYETAPGIAIRENESLFPWIESAHVLAITLVVGSIAIVDLRLIGVASLDRAVTRLTNEVLPVTWTAFALAVVTGGLLFISNAMTYAHNTFFQLKMIALLVAGANMLYFHFHVGRDIGNWGGSAAATPVQARLAGCASLLLWVCVVAFGRWIGFTLQPHMPAG